MAIILRGSIGSIRLRVLITIIIPSLQDLGRLTLRPRPFRSISQRGAGSEDQDGHQGDDNQGGKSETDGDEPAGEVKCDTEHEDGEIEGGEVVVEEELTTHEEEGEVMVAPCHKEKSSGQLVVLAQTSEVIAIAALVANDKEDTNGRIEDDRET